MTDTLGLVVRLVGVFALLALVLWLVQRTGGLGARRAGTPLQVLSTTRLAKSATLSVVRVHDEEYVLGVTGSTVTVVAHRPAPVDPARAAARAATIGSATGSAVPTGAPVVTPPTATAFLLSGWRVLRSRPVEATAVSPDAVATALAQVRGLDAPPPAAVEDSPFAADLAEAMTLAEALTPAEAPTLAMEPTLAEQVPVPDPLPGSSSTGDDPSPVPADGSAATLPRRLRRPRIRTDAQPRKELDPWSRPRPSPHRSSDQGSVAV